MILKSSIGELSRSVDYKKLKPKELIQFGSYLRLEPKSPLELLPKKSSNFFRKVELDFLSSRLDGIMKHISTPKIEIAELLAFIGAVQDINAAHPLPPEFLYKILSDLAEASDISEHTYFTNDNFPKIIAQIINKTL